MADLNFKLLGWQQKVYTDKTRFRIVCAGRRTGKTREAAIELITNGLECPEGAGVMYIAPTQGQARVLIWKLLLQIGKDVIKSSHVNNMEITLINDIVIYVRGADNPDTLRGPALYFVVLDEFAFMKKAIWEEVIRPTLSDYQGRALFISSPEYRNHFFDIYQQGLSGDKDYKSWHLTTYDNETIDRNEIESARRTLSSFAFKKEYLASFDTIGSGLFKEEWIKYGPEPKEAGNWYVAADLAGFEAVGVQSGNSKKRLDQTTIPQVKVLDNGKWFVKKIDFGRWDTRETALRLLNAYRNIRPMMFGIEGGTTYNAVMPYLSDLMRKYNQYFSIEKLTHGNKDKTERVVWALQGLFEHGRIMLNEEGKDDPKSWQREFVDQLLMFPTQGVHDDMPDGLSMISQMAVTTYSESEDLEEEWEPIDVIAGI